MKDYHDYHGSGLGWVWMVGLIAGIYLVCLYIRDIVGGNVFSSTLYLPADNHDHNNSFN